MVYDGSVFFVSQTNAPAIAIVETVGIGIDCGNSLIEGHLPNNMRTELRGFERLSPKKDVMVALVFPPQMHKNNLVGSLVDISRSGLAFRYLSFKTMEASIEEQCTVFLLGSHIPKEPIRCKKVYEVDFRDKSRPLSPAKRVGLEFLSPLSDSELETVVSW